MPQNNLEFWIDRNLPPAMAVWVRKDFGAVKRFNTIVISTKDVDFKNLSEEIIPGLRILYLKKHFKQSFERNNL